MLSAAASTSPGRSNVFAGMQAQYLHSPGDQLVLDDRDVHPAGGKLHPRRSRPRIPRR